jgi:hypothetical protein
MEVAVVVQTMEPQVERAERTLLPRRSTCDQPSVSGSLSKGTQGDSLHVIGLSSLVERIPIGGPLFGGGSSSGCLRRDGTIGGSGRRRRRGVSSRKRCSDTLGVLLLLYEESVLNLRILGGKETNLVSLLLTVSLLLLLTIPSLLLSVASLLLSVATLLLSVSLVSRRLGLCVLFLDDDEQILGHLGSLVDHDLIGAAVEEGIRQKDAT